MSNTARASSNGVEECLQHVTARSTAPSTATGPVPSGAAGPLAKALKRGLAADVKHLADLRPGMPRCARLLNQRAKRVLDDQVEASCSGDRAHHLTGGVAIGTKHVVDQLHVGGEQHRHHFPVELRRIPRFIHAVKIAFTFSSVKTSFTRSSTSCST